MQIEPGDTVQDAGTQPRAGSVIRINGIDLRRDGPRRELAGSVEHAGDVAVECERLRSENSELQQVNRVQTVEIARLSRELQALRDAALADPSGVEAMREERQRALQQVALLESAIEALRRERDELAVRGPRMGSITAERAEVWSSQRVAILVDVQNMYYSAKKIYNSKISFQKLLPVLLNNRRLVRAIAYTVEKEGADQEKFYDVLRRTGFEIKTRDLIIRSDGSRKGDWDMGIAIDAISIADKIDVLVLVTGDGDFVALVNMLKSRGVRVEVASFRESTAESLMLAASDHFLIDQAMLV
ncbi:MAG TPA: NYN domain-containing protein [Planctomycetota bacterium]|nr:NYN domain-containing protein [Planctomycetota bacterium]